VVRVSGAAFGFDAPFILNGIKFMPSHRIKTHDRPEDLCVARHSASSVQTDLQHILTDPFLGPIFLFSCGGDSPSASRFQGDVIARNMKGGVV